MPENARLSDAIGAKSGRPNTIGPTATIKRLPRAEAAKFLSFCSLEDACDLHLIPRLSEARPVASSVKLGSQGRWLGRTSLRVVVDFKLDWGFRLETFASRPATACAIG